MYDECMQVSMCVYPCACTSVSKAYMCVYRICIYIFVYAYVTVHVKLCVYVYVYVYVYIYKYTHLLVLVRLCIYPCRNAHMHARM